MPGFILHSFKISFCYAKQQFVALYVKKKRAYVSGGVLHGAVHGRLQFTDEVIFLLTGLHQL